MAVLLAAMHEDHGRLDALLERVQRPAVVADGAALAGAWAAFAHALGAHLEVEDQHLLPALERVDTAEAASIRGEHARLRRLVAEVAEGVALGVLREHAMRSLVHFLRSHTALEEQSLYKWAERNVPAPVKAAIVDRLGEARELGRRAEASRPGAPTPPEGG